MNNPKKYDNTTINSPLTDGLLYILNNQFLMIDRIALLLLIIGGINWGLVGIFQFDLVAFLFGGAAAILSRIIYVLVAISAIWCISLFFKDNRLVTEQ